jgi:hypothetical protein
MVLRAGDRLAILVAESTMADRILLDEKAARCIAAPSKSDELLCSGFPPTEERAKEHETCTHRQD